MSGTGLRPFTAGSQPPTKRTNCPKRRAPCGGGFRRRSRYPATRGGSSPLPRLDRVYQPRGAARPGVDWVTRRWRACRSRSGSLRGAAGAGRFYALFGGIRIAVFAAAGSVAAVSASVVWAGPQYRRERSVSIYDDVVERLVVLGAAAIVSNGDDVTKFFPSLLGGHILAANMLAAMKTVTSTRRRKPFTGFGLFRVQTACGTAYGLLWLLHRVSQRRLREGERECVVDVMVNVDRTRRSTAVIVEAKRRSRSVTPDRELEKVPHLTGRTRSTLEHNSSLLLKDCGASGAVVGGHGGTRAAHGQDDLRVFGPRVHALHRRSAGPCARTKWMRFWNVDRRVEPWRVDRFAPMNKDIDIRHAPRWFARRRSCYTGRMTARCPSTSHATLLRESQRHDSSSSPDSAASHLGVAVQFKMRSRALSKTFGTLAVGTTTSPIVPFGNCTLHGHRRLHVKSSHPG